jgi:hypothetical protein
MRPEWFKSKSKKKAQPNSADKNRQVMTDRELIERLRARRMLAAEDKLAGLGRANARRMWITNEPDPDCAEAADEIERLRADAERYRWHKERNPVALLAAAWGASKAACKIGDDPDAATDSAMAEKEPR